MFTQNLDPEYLKETNNPQNALIIEEGVKIDRKILKKIVSWTPYEFSTQQINLNIDIIDIHNQFSEFKK